MTIALNGRHACTAHAGTGRVSSYRIDDQGAPSLLAAMAEGPEIVGAPL